MKIFVTIQQVCAAAALIVRKPRLASKNPIAKAILYCTSLKFTVKIVRTKQIADPGKRRNVIRETYEEVCRFMRYYHGLAKKMCRVFALCCAAVFVLMMTGCDPAAGATVYEIIYPSGYTRDYLTKNKKIPVEGTSCYLQWKEAEDYEKTHDYDLQILDESGSVLYEYFDIGRDAMRGSLQEDHRIWVCTELWTSPHRDYLEGWLKESNLFLIDLSDGEILFQDKAGENEFYITSNGTRCYFYDPGKEESERLFGLMKIPPESAKIYYRDTSNWTEKHTTYTFDYVVEPDIDTSEGVETRIRFYISQDQLKVAWTSYESVGNGEWEHLEKMTYEIPITEE